MLDCRRRRVRFDGLSDGCTPCRQARIQCGGYETKLAWVNSSTGHYPKGFRRSLDPESTWANHYSYAPKEIDHLLDPDLRSSCRCHLHKSNQSPFGHFQVKIQSSLPRSLQPLPLTDNQLPGLHLFHHYVYHIAFLMTPIDDDRNPWRSVYPALAFSTSSSACESLFDGLLSIAAFNLAQLYTEDSLAAELHRADACRYYAKALATLRSSLNDPQENLTVQLASLLIMVMIDIRRPSPLILQS